MIEWKDAKEVKPEPNKNLVLLDKFADLVSGYYCDKRQVFYEIYMGNESTVDNVTHWDYFKYPR